MINSPGGGGRGLNVGVGIGGLIGGWANFEVALANNKNLVWTRESAPTKDVGTTDVPTTIPYKCIVQHQVQLVSGNRWVLVCSDLFTIQSSFDQDDEGQVSGHWQKK
jgi:hypothetical protein